MGHIPESEPTHTEHGVALQATEAEAIAFLAQEAAVPSELDPSQVYGIVTPAGARHEVVDLERFLDAPRRATGTDRPATVDAFTDHVNRHFDPETSTVWVHPTTGLITAVLNDHGIGDQIGWRDHRSLLQLQPTPEWTFWLGKSGKLLTQVEFAEHIEEGLEEIREPTAADMLELAQTFHATRSGVFRSANRLHSGEVKVHYDETIEAKAGRQEDITVPTEFTLAIAPFIGEEPYAVTARLRFRLGKDDGKLALGYKLDRPEAIVRDALENVRERLATTFEHVFVGEPAA